MILEIRQKLSDLRDEPYAAFQAKLIPTLDPQCILGVRTPALRKLARELRKNEPKLVSAFLADLPHALFDENQLHAFLLAEEKDFGRCVENLERFLPHINNWATCDQCSPKVFKKSRAALLPYIRSWLQSSHTYTVRFAIGMLMEHFLDEDFTPEYPAMVAAVQSEEYYIQMEQAWYFATALAKQYEAVLPYLTENRLTREVHNKTIQKAVESYRISGEQKELLRSLRRKKC